MLTAMKIHEKYVINKHSYSLNDDVKQSLIDIWLAANLETHDFIAKEYFLDNKDFVYKAFDDAQIYTISDKDTATICGFAGLCDNYIAGFFIASDKRGAGLGSYLIEYLKKEHCALSLNVYMKNKRAVSFYKKHGFCIVDESKDSATGEIEYTMCYEAAKIN